MIYKPVASTQRVPLTVYAEMALLVVVNHAQVEA